MIRAALVLLAIRALGKCKRILQQLPPSYHRPETVLDSDLQPDFWKNCWGSDVQTQNLYVMMIDIYRYLRRTTHSTNIEPRL